MSARLAVVAVTHNSAGEVEALLSSLAARRGAIEIERVVVDSGSSDGTPERVERAFPQVRVIGTSNRGYAAALNTGIRATRSEYLLLCNPDLELLDGTLSSLVARMDELPEVGIAGTRQLDAHGALIPTMRRRPSGARTLAEALAGERGRLGRRAGERVLDPRLYDRESRCDWVSGSFLLCRRETLDAVGGLDEGFFLYSEETDLALRAAAAGWRVVHLPQLTVRHREKASSGTDPRYEAQAAASRIRLARKHLSAPDRALFRAGLALRYALRAGRPAARRALAVSLGLAEAPFAQAMASRERPAARTRAAEGAR